MEADRPGLGGRVNRWKSEHPCACHDHVRSSSLRRPTAVMPPSHFYYPCHGSCRPTHTCSTQACKAAATSLLHAIISREKQYLCEGESVPQVDEAGGTIRSPRHLECVLQRRCCSRMYAANSASLPHAHEPLGIYILLASPAATLICLVPL